MYGEAGNGDKSVGVSSLSKWTRSHYPRQLSEKMDTSVREKTRSASRKQIG